MTATPAATAESPSRGSAASTYLRGLAAPSHAEETWRADITACSCSSG